MNTTGAIIILGSYLTFFLFVIILYWTKDVRVLYWRQNRYESSKNLSWDPWFAWRPVRTVSGDVVWMKPIFRKLGNDYIDYEDWRWYYYGTIFDVIAEEHKYD